jgi:hypothetical protein
MFKPRSPLQWGKEAEFYNGKVEGYLSTLNQQFGNLIANEIERGATDKAGSIPFATS